MSTHSLESSGCNDYSKCLCVLGVTNVAQLSSAQRCIHPRCRPTNKYRASFSAPSFSVFASLTSFFFFLLIHLFLMCISEFTRTACNLHILLGTSLSLRQASRASQTLRWHLPEALSWNCLYKVIGNLRNWGYGIRCSRSLLRDSFFGVPCWLMLRSDCLRSNTKEGLRRFLKSPRYGDNSLCWL